MPVYLGSIPIPAQTVTGTFPIKSDFGYGLATNPAKPAIHRFGSGSALVEQRFQMGDGSVAFTVKRARMGEPERKALETFWAANQGAAGLFTYPAPNGDGTTTNYTCHFQNAALTYDRLNSLISSTGVTLIGVPSTAPSYTHSSTVISFTGGGDSILLPQDHLIVPLVKIRSTDATYPVVCVSDRNLTVTHLAWGAGTQPPGAVVSNGGKTYTSPQGGASTVAPSHSSGAVTGSDSVTWFYVGASPMFWQARLLELPEVSQALGTQADDTSLLFGNADRAFSALLNSTGIARAYVEYSLLHTNTGTLINVWAGRIQDWNFVAQTGDSVSVKVADGIHDVTIDYPPREIVDRCWKRFNGGPGFPCNPPGTLNSAFPMATMASCDHNLDSPNGCQAHNNQNQFGGIKGVPQTVYLHQSGDSYTLTSTSAIADTAVGEPLPEVYCNIQTADPSDGFPVDCKLIASRYEQQFYDYLGVVSAGPIGSFASQINSKVGTTPHTVDGTPPHGWPKSNDGLRLVTGVDPATEAFALGESSGGGVPSTYANDYAAGTAFAEIRIKIPSTVTYSALDQHTMRVTIRQGMACWTWDASGVRTLQLGCTNPFWITANMWLRAQNLHYAPSALQLGTFNLQSFVDAANIADQSVPPLLGTISAETQFTFTGKVSDRRPLRDWMNDVLANANGGFFFEFGRLYVFCRENSSAVEAFNTGNIVLGSLQLAPQVPSFNQLTGAFSDYEFQFQSNSVTFREEDHAQLIGGDQYPLPLKSQIKFSGASSKSQVARLITTLTREELGGVDAPQWAVARKPSFSSTVLAINTTPGMVCSLGDNDTMVDLPDYPATSAGNTSDPAPFKAHFMEFRMLGRKLRKDFGIDITGVSTHKDMYALEFGPKPQDVKASKVPQIVKVPILPWQPGAVSPVTNDPVTQDQSFGFTVDYESDADTNTPVVSIVGYKPVNVTGAAVAPDVTAVVPLITTDGLIPAGTYIGCIEAFDAAGLVSEPSQPITFTVPANGKVTLGGHVWAANTAGWRTLIGPAAEGFEGLTAHTTSRTGGTPTTLTLNMMPARTLGPTNVLADHAHVHGFEGQHLGIWALQTDGPLVGNVAHLVGAGGFTAGQFDGRILERLPSLGGSTSSVDGIEHARIVSHDADGYFTLDDVTGWTLSDGDILVCQFEFAISGNTLTDTGASNAIYPSGFPANSFIESQLWVIEGGVLSGSYDILPGNTSTSLTLGRAPVVTSKSQFVIVYSTAVYDFIGLPFAYPSDAPGTAPQIASFPVRNYEGQVVVFRVLMETVDGAVNTDLAPVRAVYIAGKASTTTTTGGTAAASPVHFISVVPSKNAVTGKLTVTAVYRPDADGTAKGVHAEIELPDFSQGAPATTVSGTRTSLGEFPVTTGDAAGHVTLVIDTVLDFPETQQNARLYLDAVNAAGSWLPIVGANYPDPTPSFAFIVAAAEGNGLGHEYAPLVSGTTVDARGFPVLRVNPISRKSPSGWLNGFEVLWDDPTAAQDPDTIEEFQGVIVEVRKFALINDGVSDPMGFASANLPYVVVGRFPVGKGVGQWWMDPFPVPDPQETYLFLGLSVGPGGANTFQPLITPQGWLNTTLLSSLIARGGTGSTGDQAAPLANVSNFSVTTAYKYDVSGQFDLQAQPFFIQPNDSAWGEIALIVNRPSGSSNYELLGYPAIGNGAPGDTALFDRGTWPGPDDGGTDWDFIAVSYDVNGVPKYPDAENLAAIQAAGGFPNFTSPDGTFAPRVTVFVPYYAQPEGTGVEVAPLVDAMTAQLNFFVEADGTETYSISGTVTDTTASADPRYWGYIVRRIVGGYSRTIITEPSGQETWESPREAIPPGSQTVQVNVISKSANGDVNSYVPGVTPGVLCSALLVAQTTGSLDGSRLSTSKMRGLQVVSGKLQPKTSGTTIALDGSDNITIPNGGVGTAQVALLAIGASQLGAAAIASYDKFVSNLRPNGIVSTLPSVTDPNFPTGSTVTLTSDFKLYRNNGSTWTTAVPGSDVTVDTVFTNRLTAVGIVATSVTATWAYLGNLQASQVTSGSFYGRSLVLNLNGVTVSITNSSDGNGSYGITISDNSTGAITAISPFRIRSSGTNSNGPWATTLEFGGAGGGGTNQITMSKTQAGGTIYQTQILPGIVRVTDSTGTRSL